MQSGQKTAQVVPINQKSAASVTERAKLARLPAAAHQVREKGKQCLRKALQKVFDNADDALFTLADKATNNHEQNLYFESMREVRIRRRHMEAKFETAVDEAFARLLSETGQGDDSGQYLPDENISVDKLTLVQNADLEELVAVDAMVNKANIACGEYLQYLSLRLDSLVPKKVYQKNNPLGPQVICQSFINTAKDLNADIKAKLVLFKLFDQHVLSQLPTIHDTLNQTLIELEILPSLQSLGLPDNGQSESANRTGPTTTMTREQSVAVAENTLNALRGLLHDQLAPGQSPAPAGQATDTVSVTGGVSAGGAVAPLRSDELLNALSDLQSQHQSTWNPETITSAVAVQTDVSTFIAQILQAQGKGREIGSIEKDVINLVKMLFEFILDDRNLAVPLKAMIGRLQIPILKVALIDKTFFGKAGHPARRLLNEMATASLGWQEDPSCDGVPTDPLYKKIEDIVHTLLSNFETDVGIFTDVLTDFVAFIDRERRRASVLERRTLDAEDGKAKAEAARKRVEEALQAKIGGQELPPAVHKILSEAWSNVLFLICLRHGTDSKEWQNALNTAQELVWSVTAPMDFASRNQLLALIPQIIKNLREGLEQISFNPFEMTQLLSQLEKLHMQRLQGPSVQTTQTESESIQELAELVSTATAKPTESTITPEPAETQSVYAAQAQDPVDGASDHSASDDSYLAIVNKLTQGSWFEMDEGGQYYRCRLAAIIKATGKYIFVNRSGMKVAEESRESLAVALKKGSLRLLDDSMLFDRALESVIGSLRESRPA